MLDPFTNPITSERITVNELDPMLHNISKPVVPTTTVAERIKEPKKKKRKEEKPKEEKPKEILKQAERPIHSDGGFIEYPEASHKLEPAEGMEDEIEFNDDDLVEP